MKKEIMLLTAVSSMMMAFTPVTAFAEGVEPVQSPVAPVMEKEESAGDKNYTTDELKTTVQNGIQAAKDFLGKSKEDQDKILNGTSGSDDNQLFYLYMKNHMESNPGCNREEAVNDFISTAENLIKNVQNSSTSNGSSNGSADGSTISKDTVEMYRLYNPNSGEHFYTADPVEKNSLVTAGWADEGQGWKAPKASSIPVYRLYNENAGDHHYTMDQNERNTLIQLGWKDEGIGWYSDQKKSVPLYREYNPNTAAGAHNYTTSIAEHKNLISLGWSDEDVAWYGVK